MLIVETRFQAYVSGLILIYHSRQLRRGSSSEEHAASNLDLTEKGLEVLEFCKKLDPVAQRLEASFSRHHQAAQQVTAASQSRNVGTENIRFVTPSPSDYLFDEDCGSIWQDRASRELLEQVCNPHANGDETQEHRKIEWILACSQRCINLAEWLLPFRTPCLVSTVQMRL